MMRVKMWGALVVLIVSISTAMMQDATVVPTESMPTPGLILYDRTTGTLSRLTVKGVTPIAELPALADPDDKQERKYVKLSPDHTKLLFLRNEILYSADVSTGICCEEFEPLEPLPIGLFNIGAKTFLISPDGTQVAATYYSERSPGEQTPGKVIVYDIATSEIVARLDGSRLKPQNPNGYIEPAIMMVRWTDEGILVQPYCSACGLGIDGMAQFWNPADDTVSETSLYYDMFEQQLVTGEGLRAIQDQSFAFDPSGQFPMPNVVAYVPAPTDQDPSPTPQVIYFNPDNVTISWVMEWVADGQGVFIKHYDETGRELAPEAYLVLRDGTQMPLSLPTTRHFMVGMPDGWLMSDSETMGYVYYRLTGTTLEEIVIDANDTEFPSVVEAPMLGTTVLPGSTFPTVVAPLDWEPIPTGTPLG